MRFVSMVVTPEQAKEWLGKNQINRTISRKRVEAYAREFLRGGWYDNGETIKIGEDGTLKDGQHRLSAIVKANVPVKMSVLFDVPSDINFFDRGRMRSVTDTLLVEGMPKVLASNLAVATAKLGLYVRFSRTYNTENDIREYLLEHPEEMATALNICAKRSAKARSGTVNTHRSSIALAVFYALLDGMPQGLLEKFVGSVATGLYDGKEESAAAIIRNDLLVYGKRGGTSEQIQILNMVEKAITDYVAKKERKVSYSVSNNKVSLKSDERYGREEKDNG